MDTVTEKFAKIGARAKVAPFGSGSALRIDVRTDKDGEFFDLRAGWDVVLEALDVRPRDRHLLLLARGEAKARFLCGHDERHWFVAAIPEATPVSTVAQAKDALKPRPVRERAHRLSRKHRNRRRNPAFVRQGEWFFIPARDFVPGPTDCVMKNEPLRRSWNSKPHVAAEAIRTGGETRYFLNGRVFREHFDLAAEVRAAFPSGMREREFRTFMKEHGSPALPLSPVTVDPELYARGTIRHPDHKTVELPTWHRAYMNTENEAAAMRHVVFID